jgi:ADP-ribose pyrophosphatase
MEETIVTTRKVYSGRVVNLDIHEVRLPNGEHSIREQVHHPGAVAIVAFDDDALVLMVRQYRLPARQVMLELPAGTLTPDEAPEACAERELQEETGYRPGRLQSLGGFYAAPGYTTEYIHLFLARDLTASKLQQDSDEFLEVTRLTLADALRAIETGEIIDGKTIIGLLKVARTLGV